MREFRTSGSVGGPGRATTLGYLTGGEGEGRVGSQRGGRERFFSYHVNPMSKHWKEPYTEDAARALGIHGPEGVEILGDNDAEWIYYVRVCDFTFGFFSLGMIEQYLEFYSRKTLPTSRFHGVSPYSNGPAASVGDGQSPFERLPGHLRKENKRIKVVKALQRALEEFS